MTIHFGWVIRVSSSVAIVKVPSRDIDSTLGLRVRRKTDAKREIMTLTRLQSSECANWRVRFAVCAMDAHVDVTKPVSALGRVGRWVRFEPAPTEVSSRHYWLLFASESRQTRLPFASEELPPIDVVRLVTRVEIGWSPGCGRAGLGSNACRGCTARKFHRMRPTPAAAFTHRRERD